MSLALAILLFGLGLGFIVAEVLFPSLGLLSLLATACIVGAVAIAFAESPASGVRFLVAVALLVPLAILFGLRIFPNTPLGRHMVSRGLSFSSSAATDHRDLELAGHEGLVEAPLHPAGIARIDGRRVDVVSRGEMIEAGARVRVLEVRGNRVVVARSEEHGEGAGPAGSAGGGSETKGAGG
jgi:membrane-bound serine protease (ClpP class)